MSVPVLVVVGLLGGAGATARYVLDRQVRRRVGGAYPCGILVVNLSGAFVLGVLVGAAVRGDAYLLPGAGLLGAYTTFSAWVFNGYSLAVGGRRRLAVLDIVASLVLGLAAVWLGRKLGLGLATLPGVARRVP